MNDLTTVAAVAHLAEAAARPGSTAERSERAFAALHELTGCDAIELTVWDPAAGRHRCAASIEYTPEELAHADSPAIFSDDGYRLARRSRWPLRMSEVRSHAPPLEGTIELSRFGEGLTACLFTRELRYRGMVNLSRFGSEPLGEEQVATVALVTPALAEIADTTACLSALANTFEPDMALAVAYDDGCVAGLADRASSPLLAPAHPLLERIRARGRGPFMVAHEGVVLRVRAERCHDGDRAATLIGLGPALTDLTPRELEVLTLLTSGATNPQIAAELAVSRHTVATHIAHLLEKLDAPTRAAAAAHALREGLVLA